MNWQGSKTWKTSGIWWTRWKGQDETKNQNLFHPSSLWWLHQMWWGTDQSEWFILIGTNPWWNHLLSGLHHWTWISQWPLQSQGAKASSILRSNMKDKILEEMNEAERKAWDSLARYKFFMFGYWASHWVKYNRLGGFNRPNPFKNLVQTAKGSV